MPLSGGLHPPLSGSAVRQSALHSGGGQWQAELGGVPSLARAAVNLDREAKCARDLPVEPPVL